MNQFVCVFVLWSLCVLVRVHGNNSVHQRNVFRGNDKIQTTGYRMLKRISRSPVGKGAKVIRQLMKDVYEVPTQSTHYKKFIRHGSEKDAIDDFWSTHPRYYKVKKSRAGEPVTDGYVGNTMIRLNTKDRLQNGRPTITLRTRNEKMNVKIVYMHIPKEER